MSSILQDTGIYSIYLEIPNGVDLFSSMLWGIVFGLAVAVGGRWKLFDDAPTTPSLLPPPFALMTALGCACALAAYTAFCAHCQSKPDCNAVHSYMSIVPVRLLRYYVYAFFLVFTQMHNVHICVRE